MAILSKACKPNNLKSHKSLKLSFTYVQGGFCSNFAGCETFLELNSYDILAVCETKLDEPTDSVNLSTRGYLPLIWKNSVTNLHGLAVHVKEGLFYIGIILRKL